MVIGRVPKPYRPCVRRPAYSRASSSPVPDACTSDTPPDPGAVTSGRKRGNGAAGKRRNTEPAPLTNHLLETEDSAGESQLESIDEIDQKTEFQELNEISFTKEIHEESKINFTEQERLENEEPKENNHDILDNKHDKLENNDIKLEDKDPLEDASAKANKEKPRETKKTKRGSKKRKKKLDNGDHNEGRFISSSRLYSHKDFIAAISPMAWAERVHRTL